MGSIHLREYDNGAKIRRMSNFQGNHFYVNEQHQEFELRVTVIKKIIRNSSESLQSEYALYYIVFLPHLEVGMS